MTTDGAGGPGDEEGRPSNVGHRFDRLPAKEGDRQIPDRPTRAGVLSYFDNRFGIDPAVFDSYSFWERGVGKIWLFRGTLDSPVDIEGLGMFVLRTRQEHWKPTLEFAQRFGPRATTNRIHLSPEQARAFFRGEDQELDWEGDWGYLVVTHDLAGEPEPLGIGLYVHGELRSVVPSGRRRDLE